MLDRSAIRSEFPILGRRTYLNSCSLGALSRRSEAYLAEFTEHWHDMGASAWYGHWLDRVEDLRTRVAAFLGATPREIALLPSTSCALAVITESVRLEGRNRVVCTELDFPTLAYQWAVKPEIELVVLRSPDGVRIDPEQFEAAVDERTLVLATSHVFFTTGYEQDITALSRIARRVGAYSLIDGYQGAGQVELNVTETDVDFYTTGPLKWLCGGPGLAYLYVREELVERLEPRITSWFATKGQFDFDLEGFEYRPDARRFEMSTRQPRQIFSPARFAAPQRGQGSFSPAPHWRQKLEPAGLSTAHTAHLPDTAGPAPAGGLSMDLRISSASKYRSEGSSFMHLRIIACQVGGMSAGSMTPMGDLPVSAK